MEGEDRRRFTLFFVQFVRFGLAFANRQRFGLVGFDLLWSGLNIEEHGFLGHAVVILGPYDELSTIGNLNPVDDEGVVVANVPGKEGHKVQHQKKFAQVVPENGRNCGNMIHHVFVTTGV